MIRHRLTEDDEKAVKEQYTKRKVRVNVLASTYGVTRQGIWKALQRQGVKTELRQSTRRKCAVCDTDLYVRRGRIKHTLSFCNEDCYMTYLESLGEEYKPNAYKSRKSRQIVHDHFPGYRPDLGHTVHHVDKDVNNISLPNLWVFASGSDHLKYHRKVKGIRPIWRGDLYYKREG